MIVQALKRQAILFALVLTSFLGIWAAHAILLLGQPTTTPGNPSPSFDIGLSVSDIVFKGEAYDVTFGLTPPTKNAVGIFQVYYSPVSGSNSPSTINPSGSTIQALTYGNPGDFPFDRYYTILSFKLVSGGQNQSVGISPATLSMPLRLVAGWWVFPRYFPSSVGIYLVRNPYDILLTSYLPILILCFVPVVFFLESSDLTNRLLLIFAIVFGSLTISPGSPVPFFTILDFLKGALLLATGLVVIYSILLKKRIEQYNSQVQYDSRLNWLPSTPFFPPIIFWLGFLINERIIQNQFPESLNQLWLFTLDFSIVVALLVSGGVVLATALRYVRFNDVFGRNREVILSVLVGAIFLLPVMFIFIELQRLTLLSVSTFVVYGIILVSLAFMRNISARKGFVCGLLIMIVAVLLWIVSINNYMYFASFLTTYSPNVIQEQPTMMPGLYVTSITTNAIYFNPIDQLLAEISEYLIEAVGLISFVLFLALPAGLMGYSLAWRRLRNLKSAV